MDKSLWQPVAGVRLGTARAGVRYPDRRDLVLIELAEGGTAAGVFTQNAFCAAPVTIAKRHLAEAAPRLLLINTGNANAGTGAVGVDDTLACCNAAAALVGCRCEEVLPFSTGVIGERLPVDAIKNGLPACQSALGEDGWSDAAWGILTTDTRPKLLSRQFELDGRTVTLTGIVKGSGMICPNMATMLAFVATDAGVEAGLLQHYLNVAVADSFNAVSVDGDTSTNDACVLIASGASGVEVTPSSRSEKMFCAALNELCEQLARELVRDGEGATKLITIDVSGGRDRAECRQAGYTIAHSPLVKTAFFASDPNWGRLLMALGRAGLDALDVGGVAIYLDDVCIVRDGAVASDYTEERGATVMARDDITVRIELGRGDAHASLWTCDFSYDYVKINAEYRS